MVQAASGTCGFDSREVENEGCYAGEVNVGRRLLGMKEMSGSTPEAGS